MASREVSTMIKQGFISDPTISLSFSPSRTPAQSTTITLPRVYSPSSSPPPPDSARANNNPTLFEMMSEEHNRHSKSMEDTRKKAQTRVAKFLTELNSTSFTNCELGSGDVKLTVVSRDGFRVSMEVHKRV